MPAEIPQELTREVQATNSALVENAYDLYVDYRIAQLPEALKRDSHKHYYLSVYPGLQEMYTLYTPPSYPEKVNNVYVHTPFCSGVCDFCSYLVQGIGDSKSEIEMYYQLLDREVEGHRNSTKLDINYIYFGGGTPSLVPPKVLGSFLYNLYSHDNLSPNVLGTVELHPEFFNDLDNAQSYIDTIKSYGINRVSLGYESADDNVLAATNRRHGTEFLKHAVDLIKQNDLIFNIDLMYGLPGLSLSAWENTLSQAIDSDPDSITPYFLFVDKRTGIRKSILNGTTTLPSSDHSQLQHIMAQLALTNSGYYELPNDFFGKSQPGDNPQEYKQTVLPSQSQSLPIGAGAYGYFDRTQFYNEFNLRRYARRMLEGRSPAWKGYQMDDKALLHRDIMFSIKNSPELNRGLFRSRYNIDIVDRFRREFDQLAMLGLLEITEANVVLSDKGKLIAEEVACQFKDPRIGPYIEPNDPDIVLLERHAYSPEYPKLEV